MLNIYELSEDQKKRLDNDYTYHAPKTDQLDRYHHIREVGKYLAMALMQNCPNSRELSVALTHLDQVIFNANAAIARNEKEDVRTS
jgi:hypothetical protein